ncbi:glycosyltransferase family 25 protein [Chitiniphilus shinanonensis]|uniref:glycosyltransferase family 25 protein n=1 Tax=Chitiniphilus shinanonensis TaxID=553088 RepID=UPI003062FC00
MTPRIVVINLGSANTRRQQMSEELGRFGMEFEFFPAVDGRLLDSETLARHYDALRAATTPWGHLTVGEVGCALSHRAVWQLLVDSGEPGWIVFEDDSQISADFPEVAAALPGTVRPGEVAAFVQTNANTYYWHSRSLANRKLVYVNQAFYCATGYYITEKAARKLLAASNPIWFPIDCWYTSPGFRGITPILAVWPPIVSSREENQAPSQIGFRNAHSGKLEKKQGSHSLIRKWISRGRRYIKNRFLNHPVLR